MATVHNAYYNSPWIADAARNLATALAPPDPQKTLENQRAQWLFERQQEKALIEDRLLREKDEAEDAFAEMLIPVKNPLTGEVDQKLTNEKIMTKWADAIRLGGDPGTGESLSGELNPEVAVKRQLAKLKAAETLGLANFNWNRRDAFQNDAQSATAEENAKNRAFQAEQNALRLKNYLDAQRLRNQGKGGTGPNEIPVPILKEIAFGLDDMIAATRRDMSLEAYNKFAEEASKRWQVNGNVQQSLNEQWAYSFPNSRTYETAEADADMPGFFGGQRGLLKPRFDDEPTSLGDAATQTPAQVRFTPPAPTKPAEKPPAAPPRAAPSPTRTVAPKTPPVKALKEGVVTTFKNGEKWTLKNGVPTKVN